MEGVIALVIGTVVVLFACLVWATVIAGLHPIVRHKIWEGWKVVTRKAAASTK